MTFMKSWTIALLVVKIGFDLTQVNSLGPGLY